MERAEQHAIGLRAAERDWMSQPWPEVERRYRRCQDLRRQYPYAAGYCQWIEAKLAELRRETKARIDHAG